MSAAMPRSATVPPLDPAPVAAAEPAPILTLEGVSKRFVKKLDLAGKAARMLGAKLSEEVVHAVDHVDLAIRPGEVVGLVGESGCGKSTLGRLAVGLHTLSGGVRRWKGVDLARDAQAAKQARLQIQLIFQDPYASLNPRLRVTEIVGEAPVAHGLIQKRDQVDFVAELLQRVGLDGSLQRRFPHQFSGGQRARIGIARALAVNPEFLVCDEAIAALDVSIQAQVLNLLKDLVRDLGLSLVFIAHDLSVVAYTTSKVYVMSSGKIVEVGRPLDLFRSPKAEATQALVGAVLSVEAGLAGTALA